MTLQPLGSKSKHKKANKRLYLLCRNEKQSWLACKVVRFSLSLEHISANVSNATLVIELLGYFSLQQTTRRVSAVSISSYQERSHHLGSPTSLGDHLGSDSQAALCTPGRQSLVLLKNSL